MASLETRCDRLPSRRAAYWRWQDSAAKFAADLGAGSTAGDYLRRAPIELPIALE